MTIGIIFAMQEELDAFKALYPNNEEKNLFHLKLTIITTDKHTFVCVLSGIGKSQAASATTLLLSHYDIDLLFNSGVAGGVGVSHASIVLAEATLYHDVDVQAFNYLPAQLPGQDVLFPADETLLDYAVKICETQNITYTKGLIASGDQFVTSLDPLKTILEHYPQIKAIEMESASIAHMAKNFKVKHLIIRSISDVIGDESQQVDFNAFVNEASQKAATLLKAITDAL